MGYPFEPPGRYENLSQTFQGHMYLAWLTIKLRWREGGGVSWSEFVLLYHEGLREGWGSYEKFAMMQMQTGKYFFIYFAGFIFRPPPNPGLIQYNNVIRQCTVFKIIGAYGISWIRPFCRGKNNSRSRSWFVLRELRTAPVVSSKTCYVWPSNI